MRSLTTPVATGAPLGVAGSGIDPVYADPNLLVLGFLLVGCLLYASILALDAATGNREAADEDEPDPT